MIVICFEKYERSQLWSGLLQVNTVPTFWSQGGEYIIYQDVGKAVLIEKPEIDNARKHREVRRQLASCEVAEWWTPGKAWTVYPLALNNGVPAYRIPGAQGIESRETEDVRVVPCKRADQRSGGSAIGDVVINVARFNGYTFASDSNFVKMNMFAMEILRHLLENIDKQLRLHVAATDRQKIEAKVLEGIQKRTKFDVAQDTAELAEIEKHAAVVESNRAVRAEERGVVEFEELPPSPAVSATVDVGATEYANDRSNYSADPGVSSSDGYDNWDALAFPLTAHSNPVGFGSSVPATPTSLNTVCEESPGADAAGRSGGGAGGGSSGRSGLAPGSFRSGGLRQRLSVLFRESLQEQRSAVQSDINWFSSQSHQRGGAVSTPDRASHEALRLLRVQKTHLDALFQNEDAQDLACSQACEFLERIVVRHSQPDPADAMRAWVGDRALDLLLALVCAHTHTEIADSVPETDRWYDVQKLRNVPMVTVSLLDKLRQQLFSCGNLGGGERDVAEAKETEVGGKILDGGLSHLWSWAETFQDVKIPNPALSGERGEKQEEAVWGLIERLVLGESHQEGRTLAGRKRVDVGRPINSAPGRSLAPINSASGSGWTLGARRKPQANRAERGHGVGGGDGRSVYIGNLAPTVSRDDLWTFCSDCGTIDHVCVCLAEAQAGSPPRRFGIVRFADAQGVREALDSLRGEELQGCRVHLQVGFEQGRSGRRKEREDAGAGGA